MSKNMGNVALRNSEKERGKKKTKRFKETVSYMFQHGARKQTKNTSIPLVLYWIFFWSKWIKWHNPSRRYLQLHSTFVFLLCNAVNILLVTQQVQNYFHAWQVSEVCTAIRLPHLFEKRWCKQGGGLDVLSSISYSPLLLSHKAAKLCTSSTLMYIVSQTLFLTAVLD